jgi:hypothetical protein
MEPGIFLVFVWALDVGFLIIVTGSFFLLFVFGLCAEWLR